MAETIKGGRYQNASGQWVNANGQPIPAPVDETAEKTAPKKGKGK